MTESQWNRKRLALQRKADRIHERISAMQLPFDPMFAGDETPTQRRRRHKVEMREKKAWRELEALDKKMVKHSLSAPQEWYDRRKRNPRSIKVRNFSGKIYQKKNGQIGIVGRQRK
jgi:hypothetical protein